MSKNKPSNSADPVTVVANDPDSQAGTLRNIGGSRSDHWNNILANQTLQWRTLEKTDALGARIMAMPAHTVRGIAAQARVVMSFPDDELEKAVKTDEASDYSTVLVGRLLRSIETAATA